MKRQERQEHQLKAKWEKLKEWQIKNNFELTQTIPDYETFKIAWKETKEQLGPKNTNVMRQLKNDLKYPTRYNYRLRAYQAYKEYIDKTTGVKEISWKSWNQLTYQEMAEFMKDDIKSFYREMLETGKSVKEAKKDISYYYFGSL